MAVSALPPKLAPKKSAGREKQDPGWTEGAGGAMGAVLLKKRPRHRDWQEAWVGAAGWHE